MIRATTIALVALVAALAAAGSATARDGDVRARGTCTKGSAVKMKLSEEDGRIEVEVEVDQNRAGVRWKVTVSQERTVVIRTSAVTRPPSGSFTVRRLVPDAQGRDTVSAVATSPSGERCTVSAGI